MEIPIVANVLGVLGAVCWSVQLLPQILINYRRHHTIGLQPTMMLLWAAAGVPLGAYNIVERFNIALRIQPQILTCLSLITWMQCCYYGNKWSGSKCILTVLPIAILFGATQTALILGLQVAVDRSIEWPVTMVAVLSAVLLAAGVLRHYWDIYSHQTVRGISFIFVGIDAAGDLFSLVSILFEPLNILGMAIYGTELVLWLGVFACGLCFNYMPWLRERIRSRRSRAGEEVEQAAAQGTQAEATGLQRMPSSRSVFRTPSGQEAVAEQVESVLQGCHGQSMAGGTIAS